MITSDSSVISRAVDMGITYFDTARGYRSGNNERMVGAALKGSRNKIVLSSNSQAKTAAEAVAHLDTSLKELGTGYLDVWYMHSRDEAAAIPDELVAVWENAKKQGKIRHIGISTHSPIAIVDRVLAVGKFEVVLSTYNFTLSTGNDPAYKKLVDAGIGMVAKKVMAPASRAMGFQNVPGFRADRMDRVHKEGGPAASRHIKYAPSRRPSIWNSRGHTEQVQHDPVAYPRLVEASGQLERHEPAICGDH
jgi:aryl-alcohol dehydrogenase-like predicted oxidoreductase